MALSSLLLGITVTLAPNATVRGSEIELGEVASISGASREEETQLASLALGGAPAPGFARTLARERIVFDVERALPGVAIAWTGASACKVEAESETIASAALASCAETALRELFGARDAEIRLESAPEVLVVPVATRTRDLRAVLGSKEPRSGSFSIGVQAWIDGEPYRAAWATYRVDVFERRAVLARDVKRGEALAASDFEEARVRIESTDVALDAVSLAGAVAQRDFARGTVLCERDVQRPKLVKSGDLVELVITKGAISARIAAYAAQDGRAGERIRVATADKRRELIATVVGKSAVEVDLGGARTNAPKTP